MSLDSIVNVQISTQTQGVTQAGFGLPMVLAYHTHWPDRARFYASVEDMISDGFGANEAATNAVRAILSQNPRVTQVLVGRRSNAPTTRHRITPVAANGATYTVTIEGTEFAVTADSSATLSEIVTGLVSAINAGSVPVTASAVGGAGTETALEVVADQPGFAYALEVEATDGGTISVEETTTDVGIADDIATVRTVNDDWYGLVITGHGRAEILAAAAAIEATRKMFFATTGDTACLDPSSTTDVAAQLQAAAYARTALLWSHRPAQHGCAAWAGVMLPKAPGSASWKFKQLAGVTVSNLTATQRNALASKSCNYYRELAGVGITAEGVSPSGEFLDITRGVDWLQARLQERVFGRLVNLDKVPFTDAGIALIEAEVRAQLREAISAGLLAEDPAPTVTVPRAVDVPANDRANRHLPDVRFGGQLAGAVHSLTITGTVSV